MLDLAYNHKLNLIAILKNPKLPAVLGFFMNKQQDSSLQMLQRL